MRWQPSFQAAPWEEVARLWSERAQSGVPCRHIVDVVASVTASEARDQLAASSSYDLVVAESPVPEPPYTVIVVRSPMSVRPPAAGKVVIEHSSLTGRVERIERPVEETVPLFWRFVIEKFGVTPR